MPLRPYVLAAAAAALLGGCGAVAGDSAAPTSGPTAAPTTARAEGPPDSTTPLPTLPRPTGPPTEPSDVLEPRTVEGRVLAARAGCVEVLAGGVPYALTGSLVPRLVEGRTVVVRGLPAPQATSVCNGAVVRVASVVDDGS